MKIRIARRALREIERAARWWREHREDAPELIVAGARITVASLGAIAVGWAADARDVLFVRGQADQAATTVGVATAFRP